MDIRIVKKVKRDREFPGQTDFELTVLNERRSEKGRKMSKKGTNQQTMLTMLASLIRKKNDY